MQQAYHCVCCRFIQDRKRDLNAAAFNRETATQTRQMRLDDVKLLMRLDD
jgi:hypothetical protein